MSRFLRAQDVVWLLLFTALALLSPHRDAPELETLTILAAFQVIEPKIPLLNTTRGQVVSVLFKLLIGYLFIGLSGASDSNFYLILLLPVVSAATAFGWTGTTLFTFLACFAYVSFLNFPHPHGPLSAAEEKEISVRALFLIFVGFLTHQLADQNRKAVRRYQVLAEELATANQNLLKAEAEVRRSDRLAALGQLSAGLAHEIRNPLGTIRASAELLQKQMPGTEAVGTELAGFIATEVDRVNSLVTRFLDFARPMKVRKDEPNITAVVDRAIAELEQHSPPYPVTIQRNYATDIGPVPCDAELMQRVMYNLLLNAAQASPEGSVIKVKIKPAGENAEISVRDPGTGIDAANLESVFNPFFTTKSSGVGLGLAIVSKIVDEHEGRIILESELGKGSVFRILLPRGEVV